MKDTIQLTTPKTENVTALAGKQAQVDYGVTMRAEGKGHKRGAPTTFCFERTVRSMLQDRGNESGLANARILHKVLALGGWASD